EVARALIAERRADGLAPRPPPLEFARTVLLRDIAQYETTAGTEGPVFFDRSILDALGMLAALEQLTETELQDHLSTLEEDYALRISENETLQAEVSEKLEEINTLKKNVSYAERQLRESKKNTEAVREKLVQLEELKASLEADMVALTEEKAMLERTNQQLQEMVIASEMEVEKLNSHVAALTNMNARLEQRIASIAPAGFTADNFVITAHRRNNKLTAKAKRAEMINVSFDIKHVPASYQKEHEIYLVLTDFEGLPIETVPTMRATIRTGDGQWPIDAAQVETVKVSGPQVVAMTIAPELELEPGTYNLLVYADNGFLGATGFHLQ
ncbi:MAG: hypothetical protein R3330_04050, partial [Saprospiraceae bacterium]|nr:hypothetical protein [Saprospiraceae bacterium]